MKKRLGRFTISDSLIRDEEFKQFLKSMKILRHRPAMTVACATEYLAEFNEFEELSEGDFIPQYEFIVTRQADGSATHETRKV